MAKGRRIPAALRGYQFKKGGKRAKRAGRKRSSRKK